MTKPDKELPKSPPNLPETQWCPHLLFPSGEEYSFDKRIRPEHMSAICDMWDTTRTEEFRRIEKEAKEKILQFLLDNGYKLLINERITFR